MITLLTIFYICATAASLGMLCTVLCLILASIYTDERLSPDIPHAFHRAGLNIRLFTAITGIIAIVAYILLCIIH